MGCKDCPENPVREGETLYIVYTGGPPHAPFAAMKVAIPDDGIIRRYQPTVHSDGRIEYIPNVPVPPVPDGYQTDASNPWTLRPVWVSCIFRTYRVQMHDDGLLQIHGHCINPHSGKPGYETLSNDFCRQCSIGCTIDLPLRFKSKAGGSPAPPDPPAKSLA